MNPVTIGKRPNHSCRRRILTWRAPKSSQTLACTALRFQMMSAMYTTNPLKEFISNVLNPRNIEHLRDWFFMRKTSESKINFKPAILIYQKSSSFNNCSSTRHSQINPQNSYTELCSNSIFEIPFARIKNDTI